MNGQGLPQGSQQDQGQQARGRAAQFAKLRASELFCPTCRQAMPVRERLLLLLLDGEIHEFLCMRCNSSLGTRRVSNTQPVQLLTRF